MNMDISDYYIVYYHPECPFSHAAVRLLRHKLRNPDLQMLLINLPRSGEDLESCLQRVGVTNHHTFPAIFKNREFIGGYLELKIFLEAHGDRSA